MDYVIYMTISALIVPFNGIYATVSIQECQSSWINMKEQEENQIHCNNLDPADTVIWLIAKDPADMQPQWMELGRCPPVASNSSCSNATTFSRTETNSTMVIHGNRSFSGRHLQCFAGGTSGAFLCQIRIIHYEQPTGCRIFVHPDNQTVSGSCYTEKWFSSDNLYKCQWSYGTAVGSQILLNSVLLRAANNERGILYYRATCAFSSALSNPNMYNFYITFNPGQGNNLAGRVSIPGAKQSISKPLTISDSLPRLVMNCAGFQRGASTHTFMWTGVTCDSNTVSDTCAFKPTETVDERQVTCSVTFQAIGMTVNASFRLSLNSGTSPLTTVTAGSTPTPIQSTPHTSTTIGTATEGPSASKRGRGNSATASNSGVAAIAGGIAGAVVVIIIVIVLVVVIVKRRKGKFTQSNGSNDQELEEHVNTLYEPGPDPYEINDIHQPTSRHYTTQTQPALDTVDPTYEDHNLDFHDDGYAAVSTGSPQGNGSFTQTHQPSLDHDLYSDVDAPIPKPAVAVSGPATQGDVYAVVGKSRKRNTEPNFQPDVYAQVNKSRPKTGGDVYAQVNKPAKRANSSPMQHDLDEGDGNYAEVQKPKPDLKPKPTLKSKPTAAVRPNPKDTSDPVKTSGGDDEYNVLTFQGRNSDTPTNPDAGRLYSHIGSDV